MTSTSWLVLIDASGKLRLAAAKDVAAELWPAVQPGRQRLHLLQRDRVPTTLIRLRFGRLLCRLVRGNQQIGPQQQQPGGHHHPIALLAEGHDRLQGSGELVDDLLERQAGQIHLVRPRQYQQALQRPAESVEDEERCPPLPCPPGARIDGDPVHPSGDIPATRSGAAGTLAASAQRVSRPVAAARPASAAARSAAPASVRRVPPSRRAVSRRR